MTAPRRPALNDIRPWALLWIAWAWCGPAQAQVPHVEDLDVVAQTLSFGGLFPVVCIRNDGITTGVLNDDCPGSEQAEDDGVLVLASLSWTSCVPSGLNGCGSAAADPVSAADCPFLSSTTFASCVASEWVLVQTTKSGRFFTVQANDDCSLIETVQPCRKNDRFDPSTGCTPAANPPEVTIESGYLKLSSTIGAPPAADCDESSELARMMIDGVNNRLYVCVANGWREASLDSLP